MYMYRIKITSKWTSSYANAQVGQKRAADAIVDKANFDGKM